MLPDIQSHAEKLTIIGLLAIALVVTTIAFMRKWVVWGWAYKDVCEDRDRYRLYFFRQVGVNEDALYIAKRASDKQETPNA